MDYSDTDDTLYYWRTRSGVEVDFVIYGPGGIRAIEVKNARRLQPGNVNGLKAFRNDYPEAKAYLLYRGEDRLRRDGVLCLPCEKFLKSMRPRSWPE